MGAFVRGFILVMVVCWAVALASLRDRPIPAWKVIELGLSVYVVPTIAVWAVATIVHRRKPRRAFDGSGRKPSATLLGVGTAVMSVVIATCCYSFLPNQIYARRVTGHRDRPMELEWDQGGRWRTAVVYTEVYGPPADSLILAAVSALTTYYVVGRLGRPRRPGLCTTCGYSITASLAFGRCPECGHALAARNQ